MTESGPMRLGVCYYPEHWPEEWWADDARRSRQCARKRVVVAVLAHRLDFEDAKAARIGDGRP